MRKIFLKGIFGVAAEIIFAGGLILIGFLISLLGGL
jgi:hypothetical protein